MKVTIKIPKSRITAPIDFGTVLKAHCACGVKLSYTEYDFMQVSGKIVMFDGFSGAHTYAPFDVECGLIAFPFFCGCMTDGGERVAYAGLRFGEEQAVEWKPLIAQNALVRLATDGTAGSVPISSGVCCFSDDVGYEKYCAHVKDEVPPLAGLIVLDGQTHAQVELYGSKYAVFSTGWGDGKYKCYAGYTAGGAVTAVIADFGMIDYGKACDTLVDVEVEAQGGVYVYDPAKTEEENNVARQTMIIENSSDAAERLRAYSRRGYAYHCMGDVDGALSDYMAAVETAKSVTGRRELSRAWSVYENAAEIFCARSDYDSAIKLMSDALEVKDAFYSGPYVRLVDLYLQVKQADKALEVATRMRALRPDDPVAHVKYAECCVAVTDYANAAAAYHILATQYELYENYFDEASCYIELGEYDKAIAALDAHPAKEHYEQYWHYLAHIEYMSHRLWQAKQFAEKSYELDNTYMPALLLLIEIHSLLNEYYTVARYAEEYKRVYPDNVYGYSVCAEAHLMLGNFSECDRNYSHVYDVINNDDKYAALTAVVGTKTGESKRSNALLKKLRRKKSAYYSGARYGMYITKSHARNVALERDVYELGEDDDFLLTLAVFLYKTGDVVHSMRVLDTLYKDENQPYEAVALHIRAAERINDKKHFLSFLDYYVNNFISKAATPDERAAIAESFIVDSKHRSWIREFRTKD
ncbi:MAG: tetratricopeptide repeat protein [Clostridiales bacterium]|nr:tetratricopeptide repeat protein [Clostridiales bacterium]